MERPAPDVQAQLVFAIIQAGTLPVLDAAAYGLNCNPGELLNGHVAASILGEKTYRQYVGGSSGLSVRLAKGVWYRQGSARGHSIPMTQTVEVGSRSLFITNQRIALLVDPRRKKIFSANCFSGGLPLAFTNREKTALFRYNTPGCADLVGTLISF